MLLTSFTAQGSAPAGDDRLGEVVTAFESAASAALGELERNLAAALGTEPATASN
jgi:hypothetical protein